MNMRLRIISPFRLLTLFCFCGLFSNTVLAQIPDSTWIGTWEGGFKIGNNVLRIVFHIEKKDTVWVAKMDSPDQMQYGLDTHKPSIIDSTIVLLLKLTPAGYEGKLLKDENGHYLSGNWKQGGQQIALDLHKKYGVKPREYPQHPKEPFTYKQEELKFPNEKAKIDLAGTLTLPQTDTLAPAIILISGSGAQDRDETIMGHKPFWVIADHFSRRGYAVLRFDDRGIGESGGNLMGTTADFVTDALSAVAYLRQRPEIDPNKIIIMGHSEGGLVAMMAAAEAKKEVACIVLLAAPGVPIKDLMLRQIADVSKVEGLSEELIKVSSEFSAEVYKHILADKKNKLTVRGLADKLSPYYNSIPAATKEALQFNDNTLFQTCTTTLMPWFRFFIKIEPEQYLKKVKCPVLALNGEKDIQVASNQNLDEICRILYKHNKDASCAEVKGLNHLFQHCNTCKVQEYGELTETFAPEVLLAIEKWLNARFKNQEKEKK